MMTIEGWIQMCLDFFVLDVYFNNSIFPFFTHFLNELYLGLKYIPASNQVDKNKQNPSKSSSAKSGRGAEGNTWQSKETDRDSNIQTQPSSEKIGKMFKLKKNIFREDELQTQTEVKKQANIDKLMNLRRRIKEIN